MASTNPANATSRAAPDWLNKGDNAWQITAATLIGLQCVPGLVILYGSIVKKKFAVNSAFMALYAFAASLLCWVLWAYNMAFGEKMLPFWGKQSHALTHKFLLQRAHLPSTRQFYNDGTIKNNGIQPLFPMASLVYYHFAFAALTVVMLAGSALGRMNFRAWMMFVPLWLTFSYTIGAYSLWGGGFLHQWGVMDYSGGYVIHVASGASGIVLAYRVGPRLKADRERFPPNNILLTLTGAGLLWLGWTGFNGGSAYASNLTASIAVLNTHICAATSMLTWTLLDVIYFHKPSVIGAVQGMMTGLVCITPGAGLVQGWAALLTGIVGGSIPWFTMMVVHRRSKWLQKVDDTLAVFHTHAVSGLLGGLLVGLFADPVLSDYFMLKQGEKGAIHGGGFQIVKQICGAFFVMAWNLIVTNVIISAIGLVVPLRMSNEELMIGDDAAHGEEAYALWGEGEKYENTTRNGSKHGGTAFEPEELAVDIRAGFPTSRVKDASVGI